LKQISSTFTLQWIIHSVKSSTPIETN